MYMPKIPREHEWYSGSELDYSPTGRTIDIVLGG